MCKPRKHLSLPAWCSLPAYDMVVFYPTFVSENVLTYLDDYMQIAEPFIWLQQHDFVNFGFGYP